MPTYVLTSPEGKKYRVTGEGTGEEALAHLQSQLGQDQQKEQPKQDAFSTVTDQALSGLTFGLGNRVQAGLAAAVMSGINDKSLSENYKLAREIKTKQMEQQMEQNPALSIASNLAGSLALGGIGATTKAGAALGNSLRGGKVLGKELGIAGRIGKGAAAGTATGAAYGAGTAGYDKTLTGAGEGAISGALVGGAIPAIGGVAGKFIEGAKIAKIGAASKGADELSNVSSGMKESAGNIYEKMRSIGAVINPESAQKLINNIGNAIAQKKFIPNLNPKTVAILEDMSAASRNGALGLDEIDQYRRLLGRIGGSEDGVSAGLAKKAIDDFVNKIDAKDLQNGTREAVDLLNKGRAEYAKASKYESISDILIKADGDPNRIKAGLTRFLNNPKNLRGFSTNEVLALKDAARSTTGEKLLKMVGKFGIDLGTSLTPGNTVAPLIGGIAGTMSGGAATGFLAPIVGTAARQGQKYLARGKGEQLLETISNNAVKTNMPSVIQPALPQAAIPAGAIAGSGIQSQSTQPIQQYTPSKPVEIIRPQSSNQYFDSVKMAESSGNPNAKAQTSSASGLYQFTDQTWKDSVAKWGKKYGITDKMKNNPQAQEVMVRELAADNARILTNKLNRDPNVADMYVAHVFGADQGAKLINQLGTNRPAFMVMPPKVVNANMPIFFEGKKPRTVEQVYQLLANKVA